MNADRKIIWSTESSKQVASIKSYLGDNWSITEVRNFLNRLKRFGKFVTSFPRLYPISEKYPQLRKAIISKHHSVIYEIDEEVIKIHTILDHRQNH